MAATLGSFYFLISLSLFFISLVSAQNGTEFAISNFIGANLKLDGLAEIHHNGLLQLTNTTTQEKGHAFYQVPINFNSASSSNSFSTYFVFAIAQGMTGGHGLAFVIAPSMDFSTALPTQYLGLFNMSNNGNSSNHVLAVEFDTVVSAEFDDIDKNHVGIDLNSLNSTKSATASYFSDKTGRNLSLTLLSGDPMQVWIDYDDTTGLLNVTIAPTKISKPTLPLLSTPVNVSEIFLDTMYIGFSASTGSLTSNHYLLGWSFNRSGKAQTLDFSKLPGLPSRGEGSDRTSKFIIIISLLAAALVVLIAVVGVTYVYRKRYAELREEWEREYGPQRFSYKNLYTATRGFSEKELLGAGGFGKVYRGTLPSSNQQIAVKKFSHNTELGMKQFVAEIVSMRRLRHKDLVQLLGYCRRKGELLLVYEYMPNGSLDEFLFTNDKPNLSWSQRFQILKSVASALLYLHEEWDQVVLHRDIKSSNVLLDANLNGRLGDFGLARLHDRGSHAETTQLVGTPGYLAPELTRTSKATVSSDMFAFGIFMLEVACGRRPIELEGLPQERNLTDWVLCCWKGGALLDAVDPRLEGTYVKEEVELVLKLGLACSHFVPSSRPTIRQAKQYLEGDVKLPDIQPENVINIFAMTQRALDFPLSISSSLENNWSPLISSMYVTTEQVFGVPVSMVSSVGNSHSSPSVTTVTVSMDAGR